MDNQVVSAAGWGSTSFGGPITNILQVVSLNTITNSACSAKMSNIDGNKICTYTAGKDTCQYDSGSSLYYYASRLYTVGLSSYGVACATSNPSVSTRVTSFISWIEQKTGPVFCNK